MSATQGESKELESISGRSSKKVKESRYIETLINDGSRTPIDTDSDTYEIHLPPWFDEDKFKRCVFDSTGFFFIMYTGVNQPWAGFPRNNESIIIIYPLIDSFSKRSAVLSDQSNGNRHGRVLRINIGAFHSVDTGCAYIHRTIVDPNDGLQALRTDCAAHVELVPRGVATGI